MWKNTFTWKTWLIWYGMLWHTLQLQVTVKFTAGNRLEIDVTVTWQCLPIADRTFKYQTCLFALLECAKFNLILQCYSGKLCTDWCLSFTMGFCALIERGHYYCPCMSAWGFYIYLSQESMDASELMHQTTCHLSLFCLMWFMGSGFNPSVCCVLFAFIFVFISVIIYNLFGRLVLKTACVLGWLLEVW